jgi:hypothetical protein
MNSKQRIFKYQAYQNFSLESNALFNEALNVSLNAAGVAQIYKFCVAPRGSNGGANDRLIEVFYGHRPFDAQRISPFDRGVRVLVEDGARLHYNQLDNGMVIVTLYPAKTDNFAPVEYGIIIDEDLDPRDLFVKYKRHFSLLNSYMRCTCLDGEPTIIDRFNVFWIKQTKMLILDKKGYPPKYITWVGQSIRFIFNVSLSGCVLAFILSFKSDPSGLLVGEVTKGNQIIRKISDQIDALSQKPIAFITVQPEIKHTASKAESATSVKK